MCETDKLSIAVGFFDGVHLGHREILQQADAALTFRNHPLSVLDPEHAPKLLMDPERRVQMISKFVRTGRVQVLDFTPELAALPAETFARRAFMPESHPEGLRVICGENWRFGAGGRGDAELLDRMGIDVEVVSSVYVGPELVSSTRIRELLAAGRPDVVRALMGSNYHAYGYAHAGKGIGKKELGCATVNVEVPELPLRHGVYLVKASHRPAIANYGYAPTMGENAWKKPVIELHYLHERDLKYVHYDKYLIDVSVTRFLRPERKFDSLAELKTQIQADIAMAEAIRAS